MGKNLLVGFDETYHITYSKLIHKLERFFNKHPNPGRVDAAINMFTSVSEMIECEVMYKTKLQLGEADEY